MEREYTKPSFFFAQYSMGPAKVENLTLLDFIALVIVIAKAYLKA